MSSDDRQARQDLLKGLGKLASEIDVDESSANEDADGWCELVWESCDEEGDSVQEHLAMCALLDEHGVEHELTSSGPVFYGYSEYTPDPGWVMRIKVKLSGEVEYSNELDLAVELVQMRANLLSWRKTAIHYSNELKMYGKQVKDFSGKETLGELGEFIRAAYMENPDLYDMDPCQFPVRQGGGFGVLFKALYPVTELDDLVKSNLPLCMLAKKEPLQGPDGPTTFVIKEPK